MKDKEDFRFDSRGQYEAELMRMAMDCDDDEYEVLAEEYVRFCDSLVEQTHRT